MTDDWDRRCIMNILGDYYKPEVIDGDYNFDENGIYHQVIKSIHFVRFDVFCCITFLTYSKVCSKIKILIAVMPTQTAQLHKLCVKFTFGRHL